MNIRKIILFLAIIIIITGCNNKESDAIKFKKEYEKYNKSNIKLEIDEDNIIKYSKFDNINKIIKEGTGVIFIGNPKDDLSRTSLKVLLNAADSTDLQKIYYNSSLDNIKIEGIDNLQMPLVVNVLEGKIKSYHIGTINNSKKLSESDEMELYNIYTDGIHQVLGDTCDEEC